MFYYTSFVMPVAFRPWCYRTVFLFFTRYTISNDLKKDIFKKQGFIKFATDEMADISFYVTRNIINVSKKKICAL